MFVVCVCMQVHGSEGLRCRTRVKACLEDFGCQDPRDVFVYGRA